MSPRADDLRVYDEASAPVRRWLADVDDLLAAVAVAGLAWPDPDLANDLAELAQRAEALGATEGARRLSGLGTAAEAVRGATGARKAAEAEAFEAWMLLVGWTRRVRRELDLLAVQAALVVRGTSEPAPRGPVGPVSSASLEVVGVELSGDRLAIHAVEPGTEEPYLLLDQLVELSDADPLGRPVISRLFQRRLELAAVLAGRIQLDAHPVLRRGDTQVIRPAFDRAPVVHERAQYRADPAADPLTLGREGDRVVVRDGAGELVAIPETAVLRFTATKLAIRQGGLGAVRGRLRRRKTQRALLAVEVEPDGRCWPCIDPRAFPLSPGSLAEALAGSCAPGALWLRSVLVRQGADDDMLGRDLAAATPETVDEAWLIGRAHRAAGLEIPAMCVGFAAPTLVAADATPDERWQAIWLVLASDGLPAHAAVLQRAYEAFYDPAPTDPVPADLAARAVLMDTLQLGGIEGVEPSARALGWLDAHLAALRLGARSREPRLPSLRELAWLAETRLLLTGEGGATPLAGLDLPADRLRLVAIEAMWACFGAERVGPPSAAADAIWAMGLAGLGGQLFSSKGSGP